MVPVVDLTEDSAIYVCIYGHCNTDVESRRDDVVGFVVVVVVVGGVGVGVGVGVDVGVVIGIAAAAGVVAAYYKLHIMLSKLRTKPPRA